MKASLQSLDLSECRELERLPDSIQHLSALQTLKLWGCKKLAGLPSGFTRLGGLQTLDLGGCDALEFPPGGLEGLSGLSSLRSLGVGGCLPSQARYLCLVFHSQGLEIDTSEPIWYGYAQKLVLAVVLPRTWISYV